MTKKNQFIQSPLPFQGQKRKFLKAFKAALNQFPADATYIDLFGGSGFLSHTVKQHYPTARVLYNDYDNFRQRLAHIPATNRLLSELRELISNTPRKARVAPQTKSKINQHLEEAARCGFVDWITLSGNLLFSGKYAVSFEEFTRCDYYNRIRLAPYNADGYLEGVEVISEDYRTLFDRFKDTPNVVFLIDPPYLSTDVHTYKSVWGLKDYLDVLHTLKGNFFYFTSNKSQIVELCQWIASYSSKKNPFERATCQTVSATINPSSGYTDIMYYYCKN